MQIQHPDFVPDPGLTREEMEELQRRIAETAVFEDAFNFEPSLDDVLVAGIDQAFTDENAISGIVLMRNGEVVERVHAVVETKIPYIPGLLAFREGEAILAAYKELSQRPDLLVVDGSGRIHFREAGIAAHIGVLTSIPSIGVAKNLLCGTPEHSLEEKMAVGKRVPILADDRVETAEHGEIIGYAYQSKQYDSGNRTVNPLYISPGHRIGAETAVDFVERLGGGRTVSGGNSARTSIWGDGRDYKLPEPTRLADKYVEEVKNAFKGGDQRSLSDY